MAAMASGGESAEGPAEVTSLRSASGQDLAISLNLGNNFTSQFTLRERIGKGAYAEVYRASRRNTGEDVAVKLIDLRPIRMKENYSKDRLLREVKVMQDLTHPNIIHLENVLWADSGNHLILVMEYAPGQELFDAIISRGHFSEDDARTVAGGILSALRYCHKKGYVHRDVKPENVQLLKDGSVKLLDFGLSRSVGRGNSAKTFAGTPEYFAPEVDPRRRAGGQGSGYGVEADCWSMGAVIYVMLSGIFPEFKGRDKDVVSFDRSDYWGHTTSEARDLIAGLMHADPSERLTASAALNHPWFRPMGSGAGAGAGAGAGTVDGQGMSRGTGAVSANLMPNKSTSNKRMASQELSRDESMEYDSVLDTGIASALQHTPVEPSSALAAIGSNSVVHTGDRLIDLHLRVKNIYASAFKESNERGIPIPPHIAACAVMCREQMLTCSTAMQNLGFTANSVLDLMPDIKLAVEEGETKGAAELFAIIQSSITERREETDKIIQKNRDILVKLAISLNHPSGIPQLADGNDETKALGAGNSDSSFGNYTSGSVGGIPAATFTDDVDAEKALELAFPIHAHHQLEGSPERVSGSVPPLTTPPRGKSLVGSDGSAQYAQDIFSRLKQIDFVLHQYSRFWTTMQSNLSLLLQRNNHIQGLLRVTHNPRLRARFFHRMSEYSKMWKMIYSTSNRYAVSFSASQLSSKPDCRALSALCDGRCETDTLKNFNDTAMGLPDNVMRPSPQR